ncbi:MAG: hypothetical protein EVJ47_00500 [Candidatus Acidulodesulfobacterium ferriphilum]|jgi:hypothetical protein|uniref:Uncharacterized protein n=1 Tax=Candidatus Acidulodesulfobacterium ferriphilum TaxID=2597223 RepID=A0A519BBZ6_9DELT|nr:MAG: hypothetical protein EVJ47_00500 [Candidatus Acidulodesulfobacterium ferriphilum]
MILPIRDRQYHGRNERNQKQFRSDSIRYERFRKVGAHIEKVARLAEDGVREIVSTIEDYIKSGDISSSDL